jgi:polyisoprenoid-binding protein YceI
MIRAALCLGLFLAACPAKPPETTKLSPVKEAPAASLAPPQTFMLSPENSAITFVGAKTTRSHEGKFLSFTGAVSVPDSKDLTKSSVNAELRMTDFETDQEKLTQHLKTADFFDVERFPVATFQSTSISRAEETENIYNITGDLNFHGIIKAITFPAKIELQSGLLVASSEFFLNRREFAITYPGMTTDPIKDEVQLKINLRAAIKP